MSQLRPFTVITGNEQPNFDCQRHVGELWQDSGSKLHSMHNLLRLRDQLPPELADLCIRRYSSPGDVVLDPYCGYGTGLLQAAMLGRIPLGAETDPLRLTLAAAKMSAVRLDELVLSVSMIPLARPLVLNDFSPKLAKIFHPNTFRELLNLRAKLRRRDDAAARFLELVAVSRLLGYSSGYFSGVRKGEEAAGEVEYRAVAPRLIKASAQALSDLLTHDFYACAEQADIRPADMRSLPWVKRDSVSLVLTKLPLPLVLREERPLERWFMGLARSNTALRPYTFASISEWRAFVRAFLKEMLRVVQPGGSLALKITPDKESLGAEYDDLLLREAAEVQVGQRRFVPEELLVNRPGRLAKGGCLAVLRCVERRGTAKLIAKGAQGARVPR